MMHIVLHMPEIPQNTGNIVRTCKVTGSVLHLIKPLGFMIDNAKLKRAGLDYWHEMDIRIHDCWGDFIAGEAPGRVWLFTTKAKKLYTEVAFAGSDYLVFGRETAGLPEDIRNEYPENCLRIPMLGDERSLNLSNAVALSLYEALRQNGFVIGSGADRLS